MKQLQEMEKITDMQNDYKRCIRTPKGCKINKREMQNGHTESEKQPQRASKYSQNDNQTAYCNGTDDQMTTERCKMSTQICKITAKRRKIM